ncbi:MAG: hypothetical protein FJ139_09120 [Deltaproteobacteria bacterium]|nr:hypothetical protein [Deltaproteobacteria bacterium]
MQKKRAVGATLQHAPALTKPEVLLRLAAFIAFRGKYVHVLHPVNFELYLKAPNGTTMRQMEVYG